MCFHKGASHTCTRIHAIACTQSHAQACTKVHSHTCSHTHTSHLHSHSHKQACMPVHAHSALPHMHSQAHNRKNMHAHSCTRTHASHTSRHIVNTCHPAACRQHSNSFDGLCEGCACFVLGNSVCSRSPLPPHLESVNLDPISGPDSRLHEASALGRVRDA